MQMITELVCDASGWARQLLDLRGSLREVVAEAVNEAVSVADSGVVREAVSETVDIFFAQ